MAIGCRSVGKPGNGSVATLTALGRSYWTTRKPLSSCVTVAPASCSLCSTNCRCCGSTPVTEMSPRVIAAAIPHVAATMRSPITRCSVGCSRSTPVMVIVDDPAPRDLGAHLVEHRAQIDDVGFARGVVDGGHALGEHRGHQDVLGRAHRRELQLDLRAAQMIGFGDHAAVLDVAARAQLAQARLMHVQRPRSDRVTAGKRDFGPLAPPDQRAEHTHRRAELPNRGEVGVVLGLVGRGDPHDVDRRARRWRPGPRSTSAISGTSRMSGQLVIVLVPSASSAAAISFSTLFLAPPTATSPDNRLPPVTTNRSLTPVSVNSVVRPVSVSCGRVRPVRFSHGSSPDPHLHADRR